MFNQQDWHAHKQNGELDISWFVERTVGIIQIMYRAFHFSGQRTSQLRSLAEPVGSSFAREIVSAPEVPGEFVVVFHFMECSRSAFVMGTLYDHFIYCAWL